MKVTKAEYVASAVKVGQYPDLGLPEVAFCGRSNVGKSSLINRLVGRKKLVRTSSRPGRTQTVNFFVVNDVLSLVDLPGYGYAKAPAAVRAQWGRMIRTYLHRRESLMAVVHILDVRHPPSKDDLSFMELLFAEQIPAILVATKLDKLKPSRRAAAIKALSQVLPAHAGLPIPFSAVTGQGADELWAAIEAATGL